MRTNQERQAKWVLVILGILLGLVWWLERPTPTRAIARLSDPDELVHLPKRGANPRLNRIVYWLHVAELNGENPTNVVRNALEKNSTPDARSRLVQASLLRNLKIAHGLGLLTDAHDNLEKLARGRAATVTRGPYAGEKTEVDHIVPISIAPEVGNELANLEIMPATLNRKKSYLVGERQLAHARKLHEAGLLADSTLTAVVEQAKRYKYREPEPLAGERAP